jgi:hypothetical protein
MSAVTAFAEETVETTELFNMILKFDHSTNTLYLSIKDTDGKLNKRYYNYEADDRYYYGDNENSPYNKLDEIVTSAQKIIVEEGVKEISSEFFHDLSNLEEISLPNSLTKIDEYAFWNCPKLKTIYGENVTEIKTGAFGKCTSLEYAEFPNVKNLTCIKHDVSSDDGDNDYFFWVSPVREEYVGVFQECSSLKEINIPNIKKIGAKTFYKCSSLTTINENNKLDKVTYLGRTAFYGCKNLKSISLKLINSLSSGYDYIADTVCEGTFGNCTSLESVNIPNVSNIGNGCFFGCTKLKKINSNNNLGYIYKLGAYAFANCKRLQTISLETKNLYSGKWYTFKKDSQFEKYNNAGVGTSFDIYNFDGWLLDDRYETAKTTYCGVFENCTSLKTVNISYTDNIGSRAFLNCSSLQNINISKATSIGSSSFSNCTKLKSVNITSANNIGAKAFYNCKSLTTVKTGNNGNTIGNYAFYKCSSLKTVTIPKQVRLIGVRAFARCSKLKTINIKATAFDTIGLDAFKIIDKTPTFNCPKSKLKTYKKLIKPNAPAKAVFKGKY